MEKKTHTSVYVHFWVGILLAILAAILWSEQLKGIPTYTERARSRVIKDSLGLLFNKHDLNNHMYSSDKMIRIPFHFASVPARWF